MTSTRPTAAFYDNPASTDEDDKRLFSGIALRNGPPVIAALAPYFANRTGSVLEIGAGTGQHAGAFSLAFPHLDWWPSDPIPDHRASITDWARFLKAPGLGPLDLDAGADWAEDPQITAISPLAAILSMNVIHISPMDVAKGIIRGAGKALAPDGLLFFYGPFFVSEDPISDGNREFDARLRARDPRWGIRDTDDIGKLGQDAGLNEMSIQPMPANNQLVVLRKSA